MPERVWSGEGRESYTRESMKQLSRSIVLLLIALAIFFNIERLDFQEENLVDIQTFVYVLGTAAVALIIFVPRLRRLPASYLLAFWGSIYFICKQFLFYRAPLIGGIYTYLTVTEVTLLFILIWLTHRLARILLDFEEAVKNITFVKSRKVHSLDEATTEIQKELFRSRRYHRPLSLIVVEPEPTSIKNSLNQVVQEIQQTMMTRYALTSLARIFSEELRRTDVVIEQSEQGRFVILCPETSLEEVAQVVEKLQISAAESVGITLRYGTASFPDEAFTFDGLVSRAVSHFGKTDGLELPAHSFEPTRVHSPSS